MNILEIKKCVPVLMKNKVTPFLWGSQGVGKTQVMKQLAKEQGLNFIHLHLATQEVGDLVGLLVHNANGTVCHARPEWFPTEGKGLLFLDELNRAHPDVLQAMFSLITEGTIHTHKLPEGWSIVAAGNYQNNLFNVTDTSDAAWMSRFCHIDFIPTAEEFLVYAEEIGADSVASFLRTHSELMEVKTKERPALDLVSPDRRSWLDMIARLELEPSIEAMRYEVYSGIIGKSVAASFMTFKTKEYSRLSGKTILKNYKSIKDEVIKAAADNESRFDLLNGAVEEIFAFVPGKTLPESEVYNFQEFLLDIPLELGLKVVKSLHSLAWAQKNLILNNVEFVSRFERIKLTNSRKK
jgi:AAA domain (dynein-related subfamily)